MTSSIKQNYHKLRQISYLNIKVYLHFLQALVLVSLLSKSFGCFFVDGAAFLGFIAGCHEMSSMSGCVRVRLFALSAFICSHCVTAALLSRFSGISPFPALMQNRDRKPDASVQAKASGTAAAATTEKVLI